MNMLWLDEEKHIVHGEHTDKMALLIDDHKPEDSFLFFQTCGLIHFDRLGNAVIGPEHVEPGTHDVAAASSRSACIMATATELPPFLPKTVIEGCLTTSHSAFFDSSACTKPTGTPITKAGRTPSCSIRRITSRSAVGAFPTAITAPSRLAAQSRNAASVRVTPIFSASSLLCGLSAGQYTSLPCHSRRHGESPARIIRVSA